MIQCRDLTRRFGAFTAVDGISFEVPTGTICALLGPNGAGKSTTVGMLTGLLQPTSGEISVCGNKVADRAKIGVLPEDLGLFDDLTVREHLELTADIYGVARATAQERIEQLLSALSLSVGRDRLARHCSHGMRKKTSFAMALLPNPEALFLDEPFEAVDPVTSSVMAEVLRNAAARGVTVLLTSHILPMATRIADRIVMIRSGRIVWNSLVEELPKPLEELYFDLAEAPRHEDLEWLGS